MIEILKFAQNIVLVIIFLLLIVYIYLITFKSNKNNSNYDETNNITDFEENNNDPIKRL